MQDTSQTVAFLRQRWHVATRERVHRLIADLDADEFRVREKASRELRALGDRAVPALLKAIENRPSLELRRRAKELLEQRDPLALKRHELRQIRALGVLERIGDSEARKVLAVLGTELNSPLAQQAKESLERLSRRK